MEMEPFALERYFSEHEFNSRYVMCASDCESLAIRDLLALEPGEEETFLAHRLGYTESSGAPGLRAEIARMYAKLSAEQVLVHAGAEEAMFLFFRSLLSAGDHAIVQTPCYQSALSLPRSTGCQVTEWVCRYDRRWEPDLGELERAFRPNTRAVYVNSPHNPTGFHFSRTTFEQIVAMADSRGAVVFSDEVYRELEYERGSLLPAACDLSDRAVSLGVMSKTYGLPGLRIGWIATRNGDVLRAVGAAKDYTTICNSAPSEYLATLALRHRGQIAGRNRGIVARNLAVLDGFFARHGHVLQWVRPQAGSVAFPRLVLPLSAASFCADVLARSGVLLAPGETFGCPGHVRIGLGRLNMPEALAQLEATLRGANPAA